MPFQSDKQRRYLWANEPEIAREWTDRYGALHGGIMHAAGRRGFPGGSGTPGGYDGGSGSSSSSSSSSSGGGGGRPPGGGDRRMTYTAPHVPHRDTGPTVKQALAEGKRKAALKAEIRRGQLEKDYVDKQRIMHDFGQRQLIGQQRRQEYKPSFWSRLRGGIGNLLQGAGNVFKYVNPMTLASGGANLMGEQGIARLLAALNIGKGATAFSNQNEIPDYNNLGLYTDRMNDDYVDEGRVGQDIRWNMPDNLSADAKGGIETLEDQMRRIFSIS